MDGNTRHNPPFPSGYAIATTEAYMRGHLVFVSLTAETMTECVVDLERLENVDEVWVLCFRKPKPGWRVFGRFTEKNCFVGFTARHRGELGSIKKYTKVAETVPQLWNNTFGNERPHTGETVAEYLDGVVRDVTIYPIA
ncbi:hypothetical protein [Hyphomicrobium sp. CS1BSMeth3]|uniref:hypothetical protein n=1 Tax=Hyphomicrobium sp. CS1BSMeth3 TaxID=1892844 RepID=UPI00157765F9|nr:hypothetical protein [Hyphomicrobium sp. CS1BSMeth3]